MRYDGRQPDEARKISIQTDFMRTADGSCLIATGNTRVICTASVEEGVPPFLKGKGQGWVTAEYAMLPASTGQRKKRDGIKKDGRSVEIQRLIGRALRQAVDMTQLGERTITLDCDVLEADGGTRTASITGAFVALVCAVEKLVKEKRIMVSPIRHQVAAISCGVVEDTPCLDLCYQEDSHAQVDMNFVMNDEGNFIEMQGTGEGRAFTPEELQTLMAYGRKGVEALMQAQRDALGERAAHIYGNIEENATTFAGNAAIKAEAVCKATGLPTIADDSGLTVEALDGEPGVYSARYAGVHGDDEANNNLLLRRMKGKPQRSCAFVSAIALARPGKETIIAEGTCPGQLLDAPRGHGGFGYDPLFLYENGETFAEMSQETKNQVSHRARACAKMRELMKELHVCEH